MGSSRRGKKDCCAAAEKSPQSRTDFVAITENIAAVRSVPVRERAEGTGTTSAGISISFAEIFHASLVSRPRGRCCGLPCSLGPGGGNPEGRQGRLPAHRLPGCLRPARDDLDD